MAENRAAFSLRRRFSLGFSKCRWLRTTFKVPSRSIFFFNRRRAFSTDSPFFNLISVKTRSLPLQRLLDSASRHDRRSCLVRPKRVFFAADLSTAKRPAAATGRAVTPAGKDARRLQRLAAARWCLILPPA